MSDQQKDKSILEALEKMEQESAQKTAYKERLNARIQKHVKPKIEKSVDEKIKERAKAQHNSDKFDLKSKIAFGTLLIVALQFFFYKMANGDLVHYVLTNIIAACAYVIAQTRKN